MPMSDATQRAATWNAVKRGAGLSKMNKLEIVKNTILNQRVLGSTPSVSTIFRLCCRHSLKRHLLLISSD